MSNRGVRSFGLALPKDLAAALSLELLVLGLKNST